MQGNPLENNRLITSDLHNPLSSRKNRIETKEMAQMRAS